jgi:hypothetical protein
VSKYTATNDEIVRRVQLEKKQLTWLQCAEACGGWGPKIYFRQIGLLAKLVKPVSISHCND